MKPFIESSLYDCGTASVPEDGMWAHLPLAGVWDGVSAPFNKQHPPYLFGGDKRLTGGQMAGSVLVEHLRGIWPFETMIKHANLKIADWQTKEVGLPLSDASMLGGATFCFAEIDGLGMVRVYQAGDCYAVWLIKNGRVGITHNYFLPYELELRAKIAELMAQTGGNRENRDEMWKLFYPFLCKKRKENTNVPGRCTVLNGQAEALDCIQRILIPEEALDTLLLLTDGFIPMSEAGDEEALARKIITLYQEGRLIKLLDWSRRLGGENADRSHETFSEATGLAIKF